MDVETALNDVCDHQYPVAFDTVVEECDEATVEFANGEAMPLSEILGVVDDEPDAFRSEAELEEFVTSLLPEDAVGRKGYDDRGSAATEADETSF
ncbi:hypothetical protein [Halorubrum sp. SD626R]|jgi:hypothetical protein|uniref:DUF5789 family protein n=1 Tax=Halorubrum sp. SD626R TaxID=1419722 RepID=UPI000A9D161F|nr:hypothetical protein [Halorubrum sp. SD626R]TKX81010.1 hypothetical protein EXE53_06745 [Halorubrum sp. SD626R]